MKTILLRKRTKPMILQNNLSLLPSRGVWRYMKSSPRSRQGKTKMSNQTTPKPEEMLQKLILFFVVKTRGQITKIQLVKFLYLADLYAVKWTGRQLTDLNWIYYTHGPWEIGIENALAEMKDSLVRVETSESGAKLLKPTPEAEAVDLGFPYSLTLMLENIRRAWAGSGQERIQNLLNYVYSTAPMEQARQNHAPEEQARLDLTLEARKLQEALGE